MTLSEILTRGVQLELHEAVALVRDVVDRLIAAGHRGVPQLFEIDLLPQGTVELRGWALGGDDHVARLGDLLTELMSPAQPPASLLAVLQGPHASLQDLSGALAYFERPNRSLTLQELYRRANGSDLAPEADALTASLRSAPPDPTIPTAKRSADVVAQRQKLVMAAGIFAAVALGVVLIVLIARFTDGTASAGSLSGVTASVGGAVTSLSERVGLSRPKPAPPEPPPPVVAEVPPNPAPTRRGRPPVSLPPGERPEGQTPPRAPAIPAEVPAELRTVQASDSPVVMPPQGSALLYSDGAPGVVPPVAVRPQLPSDLPAGLTDAEIGRVELTIGIDGLVEVAKIVGTPPTIHESMLLSAAKAWRFQPATRNGVPVRFRTVIAVARGPK